MPLFIVEFTQSSLVCSPRNWFYTLALQPSSLGAPLLGLGHLGEGGLVHHAHPPQLLVKVLLQPHRALVLLSVILVVLQTDCCGFL